MIIAPSLATTANWQPRRVPAFTEDSKKRFDASQSALTIRRFITRVLASDPCYVIDFSAG